MEESSERNYVTSFEMKEVTASTLNEFAEKVEELTKNSEEISNIVAVVVTMKSSSPL